MIPENITKQVDNFELQVRRDAAEFSPSGSWLKSRQALLDAIEAALSKPAVPEDIGKLIEQLGMVAVNLESEDRTGSSSIIDSAIAALASAPVEPMLTADEEAAIVEDINSGRWPYLAPLEPAPAAPGWQTVAGEVERATRKFPTWPTDPLHALAVLGEEFGELTKETLQLTYEPHKSTVEDFRKEAVQTAAMAMRFVMSLDAYQFTRGIQHSQGAPAPTPDVGTEGGSDGRI